MAKRLYLSTILLLSLFLGSCQPNAPKPTEQPANPNTQNNVVENIRVTTVQPSESLVKTETFPLPNCGGTGEIRQTLGATASITKSVALSGRATVRGGGEAGIPETVKLKLEIEIEAAYQKAYESANSRLDTIDMPAAAGTHVIYDIGWYEQVFDSIVQYSIDGQVYEAPYTYKLQVPKLDNSRQVSCGTNTKSPENTKTPVPVQPTSTLPSTDLPTQSNTDIGIGKWYTSGNISLTVDDVDFTSTFGNPTLEFYVYIKNVGANIISLEVSPFNIEVVDNTSFAYEHNVHDAFGSQGKKIANLDPGEIKKFYFWFDGNYARSEIEKITVIVSNLSSIERAEWTIPVSH